MADHTARPGGLAGDSARTPASATTRTRLLDAAAALIAEVGWGRVTTRAVAQRAGVPHGAVSYHFRGKQQLLTEAALHAFESAMPADEFAAVGSVDDLISLIGATLRNLDSVLSPLTMETMREAERDSVLRERLGALLEQYRALIVETVREDQRRGDVVDAAPAEALATLLAAIGDGLMLHVLLDPAIDAVAALEAVRQLLKPAMPRAQR